MALAVYHMQLLELEKGHQWLETALAEAPQDKVFLRVIIAHNMRTLQRKKKLLTGSRFVSATNSSSQAQSHKHKVDSILRWWGVVGPEQ